MRHRLQCALAMVLLLSSAGSCASDPVEAADIEAVKALVGQWETIVEDAELDSDDKMRADQWGRHHYETRERRGRLILILVADEDFPNTILLRGEEWERAVLEVQGRRLVDDRDPNNYWRGVVSEDGVQLDLTFVGSQRNPPLEERLVLRRKRVLGGPSRTGRRMDAP